MSGGHWNYFSHNIEEAGKMVAPVFEVMAGIEHELDWALSGDACYGCAQNRVIAALEALFDTRCRDSELSLHILSSANKKYYCEGCKKWK